MFAGHDRALAQASAPADTAGGAVRASARRDGGAGRSAGRRWVWPAAYAVAAILLFLCYLKLSQAASVTSDGSANGMQAWDMLHGNWLLKSWQVSDVSFYSTELPQYALVEFFLGLTPVVVHVCAAITYTLIVLAAGLLAKGGKTGKEGLVRVLIASGIMIAPQIGPGTVLLLNPDHFGTSLPVLLVFMLLDRAPRRWWVPAVVGLALAWVQVGDRVAVTIGVLPIVVVCAVRAYRDIVQRREPVAAHWFDLAVGASALVSVAVADAVVKIIRDLGGIRVAPLNFVFAPSALWPAHIVKSGDGILRLYGGAFYVGPMTGLDKFLAGVHLIGVALAALALALVIWRFFACEDMVAQILAVGIVIDLAAYALSMLPEDGASYAPREIAGVLPFGAVLAGRVLADRLIRIRLVPVLAVVACGYLAALGYGLRAPYAPTRDLGLIGWLEGHHLTTGLGSYANIGLDLNSHGTILMVIPQVGPDFAFHGAQLFEEKVSDFDPRLHYANFVLSAPQGKGPPFYINLAYAVHDFGKPAHTYHYGVWTIMTWNKNLLTEVKSCKSLSVSRACVAGGQAGS